MYKFQNFVFVFLLVATWITLYFSIPYFNSKITQNVKSSNAIAIVKRSTAVNNTLPSTNNKLNDHDQVVTASKTNVATDVHHEYIKNEITPKGRILVTTYGEQQVGAAMSMFSLQKWAKAVGAAVIEPFVQNSMFTLPIITSQQQLVNHLRFRDYFDIDIWNSMSILRNGTPLVSWETFVNQPPKKFIFVIPLKHLCGEQRQVYIDDEIEQQAICNDIFMTFKDNYRFYINHLLRTKLVRKVCLSFYRNAMHIDNFTNTVYGNFSSSDTMVWFQLWRGFTGVNRVKVSQQYFYRSPKTLDMVDTSKKIKADSLNYVHDILKSKPGEYTAISIRTVLRAKHTPKVDHEFFFHNCLKKLKVIISSTNITNNVVFMSMDLGRFGDIDANSYMSEELMHYIKTNIFQIVYNNSLTMEQWEQSFVQATNGITDNGYIAAMQRTILENSRCLVMFGGRSNFQRSLLLSYKEKHINKSCLYEVCYEP